MTVDCNKNFGKINQVKKVKLFHDQKNQDNKLSENWKRINEMEKLI